MGGVGNQLFQYYFALFLAKKYRKSVVLDNSFYSKRSLYEANLTPRSYELHKLLLSHKIKSTNHYFKIFTSNFYFLLFIRALYGNNLVTTSDSNSSTIKDSDPIIVHGYFQEDVSFLDSIGKVTLNDLSIRHLHLTTEHKKVICCAQSDLFCCVSFRGGDFRTSKSHIVLSQNYYDKAISEIKKLTKAIRFVFFIDDSDFDHEIAEYLCQSSPGSFIVDPSLYGQEYHEKFYMMSNFRHHIIPNSTYGWWAAYIGSNRLDGTCVAPSKTIPTFPPSYQGQFIQI